MQLNDIMYWKSYELEILISGIIIISNISINNLESKYKMEIQYVCTDQAEVTHKAKQLISFFE